MVSNSVLGFVLGMLVVMALLIVLNTARLILSKDPFDQEKSKMYFTHAKFFSNIGVVSYNSSSNNLGGASCFLEL